jgi:hypothetical protein
MTARRQSLGAKARFARIPENDNSNRRKELIMSRSAGKSILIATACAGALLMASNAAALAYEDALAACRKWTGEGAGQQYKCFECLRQVGEGPHQHWVNTCPEYSRYESPYPARYWLDGR